MITLVFNANSSQNIAKGTKDSAAYCCIAWLGSLAFKRANAYKSISTMKMKQNKIKHFFYLSLSLTHKNFHKTFTTIQSLFPTLQVKVLAWSPFGDIYSFGLGRLFYKSSHQLQNFRRRGDYNAHNLEGWFSV